jgi:hypothetical protein
MNTSHGHLKCFSNLIYIRFIGQQSSLLKTELRNIHREIKKLLYILGHYFLKRNVHFSLKTTDGLSEVREEQMNRYVTEEYIELAKEFAEEIETE